MTDMTGQMGNVRLPRAGHKAGHLGAPPLGGDRRQGGNHEFDDCADCGTAVPANPTFAVNRCVPCAVRAGREEEART